MTVPYSFGTATSAIPLSQLDSNFNTPITLGNTAIQLGNTVTTLNNMTLANVTISSGNVTLTNVSVTTANVATANIATSIITSSETLSYGTANGVAYLNGSKVVTTGTALTFDGTNLGVGTSSPGYALDVQKSVATGVLANFQSTNTGATYTGIAFRSAASNAAARNWSLTMNNNAFGDFAIRTSTANGGDPIAAGTDRLVIDSSGNLGIGTSSPSALLTISSGSGTKAVWATTRNFTVNRNWQIAVDEYAEGLFTITPSTTLGGTTFTTPAIRLDTSGNLGLGVTPSAWGGSYKGFQVNSTGALTSNGSNATGVGHNYYFDGTNNRYLTTGAANLYLMINNEHRWYTAPSGTAGNAISFTQAMTLDASGNLAIGLTSASARLHLGGSANNEIRVDTTASGYLQIGQFSNGAFIGTSSTDATAGVLRLGTGGTERARIDSSGNFVVARGTGGDTTVGSTLYADGTVTSARASSSNGDLNLYVYSTGAAAARFYVGMGGTVYATSTTITAISDQRLKENIRDLDAGLSEVMALKPRKFDWKPGKGKDKKNDRGWIAQEFEQVFPDMVDTWADPAPEGEEPYKAVNADLIPVLVKALQEMKAIIDEQAARIAALEAK